jgi:hypothetical protein
MLSFGTRRAHRDKSETDDVKVIEQQRATLAGMPEAEVAERVNQLFISLQMSVVAGQGGVGTY